MPRTLLALVLLLVLPLGARAGDEEEAPAPPPVPVEEAEALSPEAQAAVDARQWLQTVDEWRMAVLKQSRILREGAPTDAHKERAITAGLGSLRLGSKLREEAEEAFRVAFEAAGMKAFELEAHGDLVRAGIDLAARHAFHADPMQALAWWDLLVETFPDSPEAKRVKTNWLPLALPSTGDLDAAVERLADLAEAAEAMWRPKYLVAIGDVQALQGKYEKAREWYEEARSQIPDDAERSDPRGRLRGHLDLRLKLVGKRAPEIASAVWFGGEPKALSVLRGRVLLLDFQATWCGPCLKSLPHLCLFQEEYGGRGLTVLALTREYRKKGVLPERPGLERVLYRGTTREEYVEHLKAFRERVGMTIPLLLVEKEVSDDYPIRGLPTMIVVDRDGTVGFVAVGGMRHHVLRLAIERRLGR